MSLYARIVHRTVSELVRLACLLALIALGVMCWSVLVPRPLPVILAMSAGHAIGGSAFACYLLAVILDATRRVPPPGTEPARESPTRDSVDATKHKRMSPPETTSPS